MAPVEEGLARLAMVRMIGAHCEARGSPPTPEEIKSVWQMLVGEPHGEKL